MCYSMGNKVFCIGFHKTGTTSMAHALARLGYRVTGPNNPEVEITKISVLKMALDLVEKFDAFQDNPWPVIYKEIDVIFPNSRFILTVRDSDRWIESALNHFGNRKTRMRKWIYGSEYGCPLGNEQIYLERYNAHYQDVRNYFKDRPNDLLVMDLSNGDGWEKLCPFLGFNIINDSFPHTNKAR